MSEPFDFPIKITAGDDFSGDFTIVDEDLAPVPFNGTEVITANIKVKATDPEPSITSFTATWVNAGEGVYNLSLDQSQTRLLIVDDSTESTQRVYDVDILDDSGFRFTYQKGQITTTQDVTKP